MDGLNKNPSKHRSRPSKATRRPAISNESQHPKEIPPNNESCGLISVTHELDQGSYLFPLVLYNFPTVWSKE